MKIENDKIVECTESELFIFWLKNWSQMIDFYSYKRQVQERGTKIIKENDDES
jgi:hypothetical protein